MKICIHRGTAEIGGSCVEIQSKKTRIIIDAGHPLSGAKGSLPPDIASIDAVLISHPHQDHYGLIEELPPKIPVYIGELSQELIQTSRLFTKKQLLSNSFNNFKPWKSFTIGDFKITPYLVDHSATDAYGFLIEGEDKRIFYSGDFRGHGRKQKLFKNILSSPPKSIDLLLMEGTAINRGEPEFPDEDSVEEAILKELTEHDIPCFLICSSQNIDRLVSAYKASATARRIFVVDIYTAWVLKEVSTIISKNIPTIDWDIVRVLSKGRTAAAHYRVIKGHKQHFKGFVYELYKENNVITIDEIAKNPKNYFIKNNYIEEIADKTNCDQMTVIYSMWKGYMSKEFNPSGYKRFRDLKDSSTVNFVYAHTGGHADLEELKKYAEAIAPKVLVPIHTEHRDLYSGYFDNVHPLKDGDTFELT